MTLSDARLPLDPIALDAAYEAHKAHAADPGRKGSGIEKAIVAYINALAARSVPDGWVAVPREPTLAMKKAAHDRVAITTPDGTWSLALDEAKRAYEAMLATAPTLSEGTGQDKPALAASPAPKGEMDGVTVKPLEWERVTETMYGERRHYWKARNPASGGFFWINVHTSDYDGECSLGPNKYPTAAAAMNHIQADHETRILSALSLAGRTK